MLNGVRELVMTKADILSGFEKVRVCTHYIWDGKKIDYMPYDIISIEPEPVYVELDGWNEDLTGIREVNQIPQKLQAYIDYLEKELNVPIKYLSVGPDRLQTLILS
jgi:adenylosuccinate synthase